MYFYFMEMNPVDVLQRLTSKDYKKGKKKIHNFKRLRVPDNWLPSSIRQDVRCSSTKSPEASKITVQTKKKATA